MVQRAAGIREREREIQIEKRERETHTEREREREHETENETGRWRLRMGSNFKNTKQSRNQCFCCSVPLAFYSLFDNWRKALRAVTTCSS